MEVYEPYNENAVSTFKTLNICLKGMLSIVPKNRTPELTQAISVCRKQIQHTLRIKYSENPKKAIQPFSGYDDNNNDAIKKKQSSLLTAALLAASKDNSDSINIRENKVSNNDSKIISISFPTNSIRLNQDLSLNNKEDKNDNSSDNNNSGKNNNNNNNNGLNILSSSNSSISIPIEITNNSISLPKESFKNKAFENSFKSHKKGHYLCTCPDNNKNKKKKKQKQKATSDETEIEPKSPSKSLSKLKSDTKIKSDSEIDTKSKENTTKTKKGHSFWFYLSSKSSEKSSDNSKNSKDKNNKEKDKKETDNNDENNQDNDSNSSNGYYPSKYFLSVPNRKDKIEVSHSLPDLVLNKLSASASNSYTPSSSQTIPYSSSNLHSSSVIDNSDIDLTDHSIGNNKKSNIPKAPIMKHSLSSQESLQFNEHLYEDDNIGHDSDDDSDHIEQEICKHCGGIIVSSHEKNITQDITAVKSDDKDTHSKGALMTDKTDSNNDKKAVVRFKSDNKNDDMKVEIDKNKTNSDNDTSPISNQNDLTINHITSILSESTVLTVSDANDENFLDLVIITASKKNGLFSKLPVELIIYIFSFFRSQSDLLSLTLVNRAIGACAKTLLCGLPRLQDKDHIKKFFKVATPSNRSLLNCVRSLQLPYVNESIIPKDFATLYPPLLSNLQHLSFYLNEDEYDSFSENFWLTMFKEFQQLRSVCLANRSKSVTDACIRKLIKNNTFLNVLDLENIDQLTDDAFVGLSEHYQLQVLSLGNCTKITDKTLFNLSSSPDILYLSVDNCWRVTDEGLKRFAETHSLVKVFRAYGCANLTDTSVSEIGKHCKKLEVLDIGGTLITDVAIMSIAEGCPNLVMLQIDENGDLTNKSIAVVGSSCKKLESIYLPDQITDAGVIPIANNCKELQEITLDCLSITDDTLKALAQCAELECISIRGCTDITEKGIDYLTKRCKLLYKIYVDDETNLNEKKLSKNYITRKSPQDFVGCRCSCKEYPVFIVEHEP